MSALTLKTVFPWKVLLKTKYNDVPPFYIPFTNQFGMATLLLKPTLTAAQNHSCQPLEYYEMT